MRRQPGPTPPKTPRGKIHAAGHVADHAADAADGPAVLAISAASPEPETAPAPEAPFWRTKSLREMSAAEWESLCDGCGRCCLLKLQDEDTDRIAYTDVACRLLDCGSCRCSNYPERAKHVPDCVRLTPAVVEEIGWLPKTCGYRIIRDGEDLAWWHPLVSGRPETVHEAGVSVRDRVFCSETEIAEEDLEDRMVGWPAKWAGKRRARKIRI